MYKISPQQIIKRWDETSQLLRDAMNSEAVVYETDQLGIQFHLSEDRIFELSRLIRGVFLGFIHFEDLYREIKSSLGIDPRVALEIYHEIDKKIINPFRKEIEDTFIGNKIGAIKESEVVQPKPIEPQVVLKGEEGPEVINLRQEAIPVSEPIKLRVTSGRESGVSGQQQAAEEKQAAPVSLEETSRLTTYDSQPRMGKPEAGKPSIQLAVPTPEQKPMPEGPVILHKKEEAPTVAQAQATSAFKQTSFGGFFGSFKTMGEHRPKDAVSSAQIEMPTDLLKKKTGEEIAQKIPVVVKKYEEPAKTIHYSDFRTPLEKTPDGQLKPVASKPTMPLPSAQLKPESKKENGGMVDLTNLTIKK